MGARAGKDIVSCLRSVVRQLATIAKNKKATVQVSGDETIFMQNSHLDELCKGFTKLLRAIFNYLPEKSKIYISIEGTEAEYDSAVSIKIRNTGINLKTVTAIMSCSGLSIRLFSSAPRETTFEVVYPVYGAPRDNMVSRRDPINYTAVLKAIQTCFAGMNNRRTMLAEKGPGTGTFLGQVQECILANIDDDRFDANSLGNQMAISRAQLFRRLKSLTGHSPGMYIKNIRLEKAKELLQSSDISVSEAAFKTGFATPSNFTKVFAEKYGITPSLFRKKGCLQQMNK